MRLLICAQAADNDDTIVSFLLVWIRELARHFDHVHVIVLKKGAYDLPSNCTVHSLGKESVSGSVLRKRFVFAIRLLQNSWRLRHEYDAVLVMQNQEYALVGGILWNLLRKHVYMWRNHYKGDIFTYIAVALCRNVFYTSTHSYTAQFKRAIKMPVGVDLELFTPFKVEQRNVTKILFLARMSPSKKADVLLSALIILQERGVKFEARFVGDPLPHDVEFYKKLKQEAQSNGLESCVEFKPGVSYTKTPEIYNECGIFVNASKSGMYDKTLFEAAACGCVVVASSLDFAAEVDSRCSFKQDDASDLARVLEAILLLNESDRMKITLELREFAKRHDVRAFGERLAHTLR